MKVVKEMAKLIDRAIWMVGCFTIISYSQDHWPLALRYSEVVFGLGFGVWYFWTIFVQPFRAGLRGE